MFIVSYYIFFVIYSLLFGLIFGVNSESFTNPIFYLFAIIVILVSFVLSFCTNLFIIWFMGIIRKKNAVIDNKFNHAFGNSLLKLAQHLLRIKLTLTGIENIPESNFVLVGNHQENSDIIILKPIFKNHPLNFIAKEALFTVPILGRWITLLGNVPISKYADRSAAESIVKGIKIVKKGYPMAIFPEGKRSFSNTMIEFKPGAFKLAMKPKADILIVTLYNIADVKIKIPLKRQKVYIHINGLLKYEDYKEMTSSEISILVKETIQKQLDKFDELYKK